MPSSRRARTGITGARFYLFIVIVMLPAWAWAQAQGSPSTERSESIEGRLDSGQAQGWPSTEPSNNVEERTDPGQTPDVLSREMDFGQHAGWIAVLGTIIMFLVKAMRNRHLEFLFRRIPRRWRIALPVLLSIAAGVLWDKLHANMSWQEAVLVGVFACGTAVLEHELFFEALRGPTKRGQGEPAARPERSEPMSSALGLQDAADAEIP